jgi:hypothetical protein
MGEAKRRNKQGRQLEQQLLERIAAGEFGTPGEPLRYCVVVDKSARGKDLLLTLRAMPAFAELQPVLDDPAFELWDASPLFQFAVLRSGTGRPHERVTVAAHLDKLLADALPRVLKAQRATPGTLGLLVGVNAESEPAVLQRAEALLRA